MSSKTKSLICNLESPNQSAVKVAERLLLTRLGAPLGEWRSSLRKPDKKLGAMNLSGYSLDAILFDRTVAGSRLWIHTFCQSLYRFAATLSIQAG
jgi:hypothetical protein